MPPQVALPALQLEQRQNASSPCSPHGGIYLFPTSVFIILHKKIKQIRSIIFQFIKKLFFIQSNITCVVVIYWTLCLLINKTLCFKKPHNANNINVIQTKNYSRRGNFFEILQYCCSIRHLKQYQGHAVFPPDCTEKSYGTDAGASRQKDRNFIQITPDTEL